MRADGRCDLRRHRPQVRPTSPLWSRRRVSTSRAPSARPTSLPCRPIRPHQLQIHTHAVARSLPCRVTRATFRGGDHRIELAAEDNALPSPLIVYTSAESTPPAVNDRVYITAQGPAHPILTAASKTSPTRSMDLEHVALQQR
ncbi:TOBE domain-containing protein [Nocardia heshunensis]